MKNLFRYFLTCFLFLNISLFKSQNIQTDYVATYNLDYQMGERKESEQFILFIDTKNQSSYFLSTYNYVKDTMDSKNPMELVGYESDFNERVFRRGIHYNVTENVKGIKLRYEQTPKIVWKILPNTKTQDNLQLQLAQTNAYGRKWFAWFAKDIVLNYGPYKFADLPGFIVNLYDEDKNLNFTLQKLKKKTKKISLPTISKYKLVPLQNYNKTRFKIQTADDGTVIFKTAAEQKSWLSGLRKTYLKIPRLDNYYPIE